MAEKEVKLKVVAETETTDIDALEQKISEMDNSTIKVGADDTEITTLEEEIENLKGIIEEQKAYGFDTTESEAQLAELQTKLDDLKSKAESGAKVIVDTDDSKDKVDELTQGVEGLNDIMVGDVLKQYGASAEGMAQQMNQASISVGQLATVTGMSEPQMISLVNNISNATFPNDEAMMYIKNLRQMGVDASNYGKSATDIDKINDAFGMGAQTTNSFATELSVLGVDMNDVSSSFNALAYANANTKGDMENFYGFLRKYDSQLSEMGYNVDQASVMIVGATQKFGGGRAALSGLADALEESDGDARALEEALGLEAGALDNASQITGEYEGQLQQLADEEHEHKTILDELGAAWEDVSLSISSVASPIMSLVGLGGQVAGFGTQLNGVWELTRKLRDVKAFGGLKTALIDIGTSAKNSALNMLSLAKNTMLAGFNALKSAGMWVVQKIQLVASTLATYAMSTAQALLNLVMSMNPIMLVVIAIIALIAVLVYLYYNVDWVRSAIDNLGASVIATAQWIYNGFMSIVNIVASALSTAWNSITSFAGNIVSSLVNGARNAVMGFVSYIQQLPNMVMMEFRRVLAMVNEFINTLPQKVWDMGVAIIDALKGALGIGSPGHMFYMIEGEFNRIDDLTKKTNFDTGSIGQQMVDNFNPSLNANADGSTGATGNNITINIENVDNEERIQQIVKAVEDALKFDNLTAGRTV